MAWSTPATWVAGAVLTAAQLNAQLRDNLNAAFALGVDAWTPYTPTLTQSATVTKTVTSARYIRIGRTIHFAVDLTVTGTGTAANAVAVGLPVTAATNSVAVGGGHIFDSSAGLLYVGQAVVIGTTTVQMWPSPDGAATYLGTRAFTAGLASGDLVRLSGTYEAAS